MLYYNMQCLSSNGQFGPLVPEQTAVPLVALPVGGSAEDVIHTRARHEPERHAVKGLKHANITIMIGIMCKDDTLAI